MATTKPNSKPEANQENVETVSRADQFYGKYKKTIWGVLAAVALAGLAVLGYSRFIYEPKCEEASAAMFEAENAFQKADYQLALEGDGNVLGFAQVAEEYGTKAGKAVYFYAGVSALQLGRYEEAIEYLKKYSGKDIILNARAIACIGDAYVGLEDYSAAVAKYEKAAQSADNLFAASYLFKAGLTYEKLGQKASALKCYKQIKDKYPMSIEAYDIDRFIAAVEE